MITRHVRLSYAEIRVTLDPKGKGAATLESTLTNDITDKQHYAALSAVESLVLAHACAGIDIESKEYTLGVEVAVEAINTHLG